MPLLWKELWLDTALEPFPKQSPEEKIPYIASIWFSRAGNTPISFHVRHQVNRCGDFFRQNLEFVLTTYQYRLHTLGIYVNRNQITPFQTFFIRPYPALETLILENVPFSYHSSFMTPNIRTLALISEPSTSLIPDVYSCAELTSLDLSRYAMDVAYWKNLLGTCTNLRKGAFFLRLSTIEITPRNVCQQFLESLTLVLQGRHNSSLFGDLDLPALIHFSITSSEDFSWNNDTHSQKFLHRLESLSLSLSLKDTEMIKLLRMTPSLNRLLVDIPKTSTGSFITTLILTNDDQHVLPALHTLSLSIAYDRRNGVTPSTYHRLVESRWAIKVDESFLPHRRLKRIDFKFKDEWSVTYFKNLIEPMVREGLVASVTVLRVSKASSIYSSI
ncbi:hypothetical protein BDQ12DRAFT_728547 [Crucibulum laeve]|uniref:F-box domain-containing protein n=1 Tax=Crucibulum laeve TaxID=68775 RepID=A0A5C3LI80_9AGAR|nr:hypothetical protein BDQ12DRAFT_728547 [Crucibulum laeve]